MDLIYTNSERIDQGVLSAYAFDLSFGVSENDFEITLGLRDNTLNFGAFAYIEGTEYGGIVDGMETSTDSETIVYSGRTWHGILNSKVIQPNSGENYFIVSGDANEILSTLITRMRLDSLFTVSEAASGINISNYQFPRYCAGYDGIRGMLAAAGAKLKITWKDRAVLLSAVPIVDYTDAPVDGDIAVLTVKQYKQKVNHLICLGTGELAAREVIHLYVDQSGKIGDTQYYTGIDEVTETYDYSNAESSAELRKGGIDKLKELMNTDKAEIFIPETLDLSYDIGDVVGASDIKSGVSVSAVVSQKIVKIKNGAIRTEYKTGG
jgi:hypothetical protein